MSSAMEKNLLTVHRLTATRDVVAGNILLVLTRQWLSAIVRRLNHVPDCELIPLPAGFGALGKFGLACNKVKRLSWRGSMNHGGIMEGGREGGREGIGGGTL